MTKEIWLIHVIATFWGSLHIMTGPYRNWTFSPLSTIQVSYTGILDADISVGLNAAAAAKSHQSCPTLCDPIDGSPPGSPVPGILQARTLEWVAISFSSAWKWKVKVKLLGRVQLFTTLWTAAYQAPLSMGFSRQEYWSGVPLPSLWVWMRLSIFTVQLLPLPNPSVFLSCTYSWFQEYSLNGHHTHHLRICFLENPTCQRWDASPNWGCSTLFQGGHYYLTRWSVQTIHCRKTINHLSSVLTTRTQLPSLSID